MAVSAFSPIVRTTPSPSFTIPSSLFFSNFTRTRKVNSRVLTHQSLAPIAALSDPFVLQIAESLEDSLPTSSSSSGLQKLRDFASESLLSTPWPSRKDEPFRFTDTSFIKQSEIIPVSSPPSSESLNSLSVFEDTQLLNLTIVDGYIVDSLSQFSGLPDGVFVGSLSSINSSEITKRVLDFLPVSEQGDLFWSLNGVGSPDLTVIYVPEGCKVEGQLHLRYVSNEGSEKGSKKLPVSNPRVLMVVEKGGEIGILEEYMGGGDLNYWTNSVMEVVIGEGAKVSHSYIQTQSMSSAHIKWTSIRQEKSSTYELIEVSTGGKLSRHNVHMQQVGSDTITGLSTFHLSGCDQTQDLHSKIVLDHPRGFSRQLHKCIVAHSLGQVVFDGNIKVNRYAQQTDAGQLTRSLILEPRATVNVKPNLQIIADDVKCSHGAAICDLEEDQLFYLQARGIDLKTARKALILSFGAEVIDQFPSKYLRKKVELHVKKLLDPELRVESSVFV